MMVKEPSRHLALNKIISFLLSGSRMYLLLDQIVFSVTNFILTIVLARLYSASEFGCYGIGLAVAFVVQFIQRNLYIVGLSLMSQRIATRLLPGILAEHSIVAGTALLIAIVGTGIVAFSHAGPASLDVALATLACAIIYFQADFDRAVLVKRRAYLGALALSIVYFFVVIGVAGLAKFLHWSFAGFMVSLSALCAIKASWFLMLRVRPHWVWGLRLLARDWRRHGMPALIQAGSSACTQHVPLMILATVGGSAEVGGLIAMRSLTQPLTLVIRSLDAGDKNRFRAASCGRTAGARRVFWRTMLVYGAIGGSAIAVLSIFPRQIIELAYHGKYQGLGGILIGWALYSALLGLSFPIQSLVYLLGRQRALTFWTIVSGVIGVGIAVALCGRFGIWGAISASVISMAVNTLGGLHVTRDLALGRTDLPLPRELSSGRAAN